MEYRRRSKEIDYPSTVIKVRSRSLKRKGKKRELVCDRFVPLRSTLHFDIAKNRMACVTPILNDTPNTPSKKVYHRLIKEALLENNPRHLTFGQAKKRAPLTEQSQLCAKPLSGTSVRNVVSITKRTSERAFDAPDVNKDYRNNLMDWSNQELIAVALGNKVYVLNHNTLDAYLLVDLDGEETKGLHICSISFACDGKHMAVGVSDGRIILYDAHREAKLRTIRDAHKPAVTALAWNVATLSSGSVEGRIVHSDTRLCEHKVTGFQAHSGRVCGLKWSGNGDLLASGGGDRIVNVWEGMKKDPMTRLRGHTGSVKALSWSPFNPSHIVTGGGRNDGYLRFWNARSGKLLHSFDTGHSISSCHWSPYKKEVLTSHNKDANGMFIWNYPSMTKTHEFWGHSDGILDTVQCPDSGRVVSISRDETVRLWSAFDEQKEPVCERICNLANRGMLR